MEYDLQALLFYRLLGDRDLPLTEAVSKYTFMYKALQ